MTGAIHFACGGCRDALGRGEHEVVTVIYAEGAPVRELGKTCCFCGARAAVRVRTPAAALYDLKDGCRA